MNAPDRCETWRSADDEDFKKLTFIPDMKMPNAGTIEDHT